MKHWMYAVTEQTAVLLLFWRVWMVQFFSLMPFIWACHLTVSLSSCTASFRFKTNSSFVSLSPLIADLWKYETWFCVRIQLQAGKVRLEYQIKLRKSKWILSGILKLTWPSAFALQGWMPSSFVCPSAGPAKLKLKPGGARLGLPAPSPPPCPSHSSSDPTEEE